MTEEELRQFEVHLECGYLNEMCPIGTLVRYWPISGPYFHEHQPEVTPVTSKFEIRGNVVVVWVEARHEFVKAKHIETEECFTNEKKHYKWIAKFSRP